MNTAREAFLTDCCCSPFRDDVVNEHLSQTASEKRRHFFRIYFLLIFCHCATVLFSSGIKNPARQLVLQSRIKMWNVTEPWRTTLFLVCPPPQELTEVTYRIAVKLLGVHWLARGHFSSMVASQREHLNFKPPVEGGAPFNHYVNLLNTGDIAFKNTGQHSSTWAVRL